MEKNERKSIVDGRNISYLKDAFPNKEKYFLDLINKSHPSDHIYLSRKEDLFLMDLWEPEDKKNITIPADLFFAKTIPMMDFEVTLDETDSDVPQGKKCNFRIVIFDHYKDAVDSILNGTGIAAVVGAVIIKNNNENLCFDPIAITKGSDSICGFPIGVFPGKTMTGKLAVEWAHRVSFMLLETWYGIQIALLHPAVKDVFQRPKVEIARGENTKNNKHRKRKTVYVKKHILTIENLEEVSNSREARKINRKCLAWYVIGHWRKYKDGKMVFIMPYWKGVLRNLKKNAENDGRERSFDWTVSGEV